MFSIIRLVGHERIDLLQRRGQTGQIECHPANQPLAGRRVGRDHAGGFETGQYETIDRTAGPAGLLDRRHGNLDHRLKRPVFLVTGSAVDPATQHVNVAL